MSGYWSTSAAIRDELTLADFEPAGRAVSLQRGRAREMLEEIAVAVARWPELAAEGGVDDDRHRTLIRSTLRLPSALVGSRA